MSQSVGAKMLLSAMARYYELMRPFWVYVKRALGFILLMQVLALLEPYMMKFVIDGIVYRKTFMATHLFLVMVGMLVVLILIGAVQIKKNRYIGDVIMVLERDLPISCGTKLLRLPLAYHQTENTGLVIGKVVRGVGKTMDLTGMILWEIVPLVIQTAVTACILLAYEWYAALVLMPLVILFGWLTIQVRMRLASHREERHDLDSTADELLGQAVTNVMTTQAFAQEEREMRIITEIRHRVHGMATSEFGEYRKADFWRTSVVNIGRVGIIFVCARAAFGNTMSMGTLVFLSTLSEKVFLGCYRIGAVFDNLMEASEPMLRMTNIFRETETVVDPVESVRFPRHPRGEIAVRGVTYHYERSDGKGFMEKPALKDLDLSIHAGETVGIVGESGSGKSTLAKLVMRFFDAREGGVLIDDVDVRFMSKGYFRRFIGYVPQEVEIYDMTVAENIAYGNPLATREEVERAARIAHADAFIGELPNGYGELVGNHGLRLSGGQRQRIGIARAVLLNPRILIFDEATSHVDVVSEQKIQRAIEELRRDRTVILIAHRLSTIQNADRIVVMHDGHIREIGTHHELLRQNGMYNRLVALQTRVEAVM